MKKYFILLTALIHFPFLANAQTLQEAEKLFVENNFAAAEKQYEKLLSSATGNDFLQARLRLAACQFHQGQYITSAQTIFDFPLPSEDIWKARFLLYRIEIAKSAAEISRRLQNDNEILSAEAEKDFSKWTSKQWNRQINEDYQTLWALRASLINAPIEKEKLIFHLKDTDTLRIPTLFDYVVENWKKYLQNSQSVVTLTEKNETEPFLEGSAHLLENEGKDRFIQLAYLLRTAYLLDGTNRQNAKIFWKTDYILLPFNYTSDFKIEDKDKALKTALIQLDLLSGYSSEKQSFWKKVKAYMAATEQTRYAQSYAAFHTAQLLFENEKAPQALDICNYAAEKLPENSFTTQCRQLAKTITAQELRVSLPPHFNRHMPQIQIKGHNLKHVYLRLYKTTLEELTSLYKQSHRSTLNDWDFLDRLDTSHFNAFLTQTPFSSLELAVPFKEVYQNQETTFQLPELEPGFYVVFFSLEESFSEEKTPISALVLNATDLTLFVTSALEGDPAQYTAVLGAPAKIYRPSVFHLYTVNLKTGQPEENTTLDMFTHWNGTREQKQTDSRGEASLQRTVTVSTRNDHNESYLLNALARKGDSMAYMPNSLYFRFYNREPVKLFAQTDRAVYRPGQRVQFSANVFEILPRGLKTLGGKRIKMLLRDTNWKTLFSAEHTLNELGSAQTEFTLPQNAPLGLYNLQLTLEEEGHTYRTNHSFRVEEFKRPDYEISLNEPETALAFSMPAHINGKADYYTGAPLQNAVVKYTVERKPYWPPFYWWRNFFWEEQSSALIAEGSTRTDENGQFNIVFTPSKANEEDSFAQFTVKAEIADDSGRMIETTRTYKVSTQPHLFQVTFAQGFYDANQTATLAEINLTDGEGVGQTGKITLVAERLKNVLPPSQPETPCYTDSCAFSLENAYKEVAKEKTAFKETLSFKTPGAQKVQLPALPEGVYRLVLSSEKADKQELIFVVAEENSSLQLPQIALPQHTRYYPGTQARVLLGASKLEGSKRIELYEQGAFLTQKDLQKGGVQIYTFPITESSRGGVSLRWFGASNYKFYEAQTRVEVPFDEKALHVTLNAPETLSPGEKVSWELSAKTKEGQPVNGLASLTVYDKSLDYYAQKKNPFSLDTLYPQRTGVGNSSYSQNSSRATTSYPPEESTLLSGTPLQLPTLDLVPFFGSYRMTKTRALRSAAPMMAKGANNIAFDSAESSFDGAVMESFAMEEETSAETPSVSPRTDFSETAYFNALLPVRNGKTSAHFTMPQSLTTWNILGFVLTRNADFGAFTAQTVTRKDFMVRLTLPRFYREGDKGSLQAAVTNVTDKKITAEVSLTVTQNDKNVQQLFGLDKTPKRVTVKPNSTEFVSWEITAPNTPEVYQITAVARSGKDSDAEQRSLPILPSKQRLLATQNIALKKGTQTLSLTELKEVPSKQVETLVLTLNPSLALSVLNSMPGLIANKRSDLVSVLNRFVPLSVVHQFYTTYPQLKEAVAKLPKHTTLTPAWDEKDPLRLMLLEQTPWLRQAQGNTQIQADIIDLFNDKTVAQVLEKETATIAKFQNPGGAFAWIAGGQDDEYLTLYALESFAQALSYGAQVPQTSAQKAFAYIYPRIEKRLKEAEEGSVLSVSYALYAAYTLSAFPADWAEAEKAKPYIQKWADYADAHARYMTPLGQIYAAAVYHRLGDKEKANRYLDLLLARIKTDELAGAYFAPEAQSWVWYNDTLSTQTVTLRTLLEIRPESQYIDPMLQWLLFNRQVNSWDNAKVSAQAVFTVLAVMKHKGALSLPTSYQINWAGEQKKLSFEPMDWTEDLQFVKTGAAITPAAYSATITKQGVLTDFASLSAIYQTDNAKPSEEGVINLTRQYFVRLKQDGETKLRPVEDLDEIKVDDEVEVHLTLRTDSAFEYVLLQDPRPAGFESEELLSGWDWNPISFYKEIRDGGTNFFINWVPAGEVTLRYGLRPTQSGRFRAPAAQIQSMYAPEFGAHSASGFFKVVK